MCVRDRNWKKEGEKSYYPRPPTPVVQSSRPAVGVGYANPGCLSACPFRGSRAARCLSHTHPHSCRVQRTWWVEPSQQVSHTLACVCVYGAETFLETHSHTLPSFSPLSCSHLSPFPSSSTPLCCFPCPLFLSPPSSASLVSLCSVLCAQSAVSVRAGSALDEMLLMLQLFGLHVSFRAHWRRQDCTWAGELRHNTLRKKANQLHCQDSGFCIFKTLELLKFVKALRKKK